MSMTILNQLGAIPAILITLLCLLVIRGEQKEMTARRFLLFLLGLGVFLQAALFITKRFITEPYNQPFFLLSEFLTPSLLGITALIMLNLWYLEEMDRKTRLIVGFLGALTIMLHIQLYDFRTGMGIWILPEALTLILGWALVWRRDRLTIALSLLCLVWLGWFLYSNSHPPDYTAGAPSILYRVLLTFGASNVLLLALGLAWVTRRGRLAFVLGLLYVGMLGWVAYSFSSPADFSNGTPLSYMLLYSLGYGYSIWPAVAVVTSAVLVTTGLQKYDAAKDNAPKGTSHRMRLLMFGLAFLLPALLAYVAFWSSVRDHTNDGLSGLFISRSSALVAMGAGMMMTLALRGKARLAGLVFILVVPVMLYQSFEAGWRVSYHEITETRAARIAGALDQFKEREGYYPDSLNELTPRDLLLIQQPMILAGEEWCYESGGNYYRLAAFYREFFSAPVSLHLYESAGDVPSSPQPCEERLAEMKEKYYSPMEDPSAMQPPTPAPFPTSVVNTQRETIQPIVRARAVSVGKWSPDGTYLVFGVLEVSGDRSVMELTFLKADTGEVCPVGDTQRTTGMEDGVREHFAWLPDGRLLYVPSSGDMTLLSPCEPDSVSLTDSYPVTFTHALDYHEPSGRVLLKNQTSFWILDGASLEATQIPNVTPNPFDLHWDHFDWSPEGNRLAISRLNGRTAREGSTLFIMNGTTGEVEHELPMEDASDQSAPMVIWASEDELLFNGDNALFLIDFRTTPPKFTAVLRDIFLLDISYPNDVSTFAWEGHHISIRVNHPRNQGIYIFHPETGQVEVIQPKSASPLLFFPNGEMVEMANYLGDAPTEDIYELIWVDAPDTASPIITVQGHLPRNYPNLFPRYLPESSRLAFSSSQGVSVISIPDGETLGFWELGGGGGYSSYLVPPSAYPALILVADGDGLYYIPLR
jgi:hypothetical protein